MNGESGLLRIPPDFIPLAVLGLGGLILVMITLIHGYGLDQIRNRYHRGSEKLSSLNAHPFLGVLLFSRFTFQLLVLHALEIFFWGMCLYLGRLVSDVHAAVYFAANTYTTLGMGPMPLPHLWHEMSAIIAISGLFTFAWTTSEMFNIVGYQHELLEKLRRHPRKAKVTATPDAGQRNQ